MMDTIAGIDNRTRQHLEESQAIKSSLSQIAHNTGTIADYFQSENKSLTKLVVEKDRWPLRFLLLGLATGCLYVIVNQVQDSDINIDIPAIGFHLGHGNGK